MQAVAIQQSTIGKKALMAVTGVIWIGYVVVHMYGNLKVFQGAAYFNEYAEGLRELGSPVLGHLHFLFIARIVLIASILVHIWAAYSLYLRARRARPSTYAVRRVVQANYASLNMRIGGVVIVLFVLFHLMQLTWGTEVVSQDFIRGDAYHNLVAAFKSWPVVIVYLLALVALGFHLFHGAWSMFQTLGLNSRRYDRSIRALAWVLAILVPVGFSVVPLAVLFGILK